MVANAIAALLIQLEKTTGKVPHGYFKWTEGNPMGNLLYFLFLGEGDVAPITHEVSAARSQRPGSPSHHSRQLNASSTATASSGSGRAGALILTRRGRSITSKVSWRMMAKMIKHKGNAKTSGAASLGHFRYVTSSVITQNRPYVIT